MYQDFMPPKRSWVVRTAGGQWLGFRRLARTFHGNVRVLLLTDLLWAFPCAWCFFYIPRYAEELGVTPEKWGYLVALARCVQLVYAPVGGGLADKWGRKRTLVLVDTLAWTTPFVIYYFSRNQYHLFMGLSFISLWVVSTTAWECLLIESVPRRHLARIISIRSVFFLLPGTTTFPSFKANPCAQPSRIWTALAAAVGWKWIVLTGAKRSSGPSPGSLASFQLSARTRNPASSTSFAKRSPSALAAGSKYKTTA